MHALGALHVFLLGNSCLLHIASQACPTPSNPDSCTLARTRPHVRCLFSRERPRWACPASTCQAPSNRAIVTICSSHSFPSGHQSCLSTTSQADPAGVPTITKSLPCLHCCNRQLRILSRVSRAIGFHVQHSTDVLFLSAWVPHQAIGEERREGGGEGGVKGGGENAPSHSEGVPSKCPSVTANIFVPNSSSCPGCKSTAKHSEGGVATKTAPMSPAAIVHCSFVSCTLLGHNDHDLENDSSAVKVNVTTHRP